MVFDTFKAHVTDEISNPPFLNSMYYNVMY